MGVATVRNLLDCLRSYFNIRYAILLVPICGFAVYDSVFQAFSSILAVLRDSYPDVPVTVIQMIVALPPMVSVPGTLLAGVLAAYIRKKYLAEFALAIIFIGGMIPVVVPQPPLEAMFLCSGLVGLGQGFLHPLANAIICQRWSDNDERSRVLGFKQAFNYIGEVVVILCIGFLALGRWSNAFLIYLGIIPILVMTHKYLPAGELDRKFIDRSHRSQGLHDLTRPKVIYLFALFFTASLFLYGYYTNIALHVQGASLGTPADVSVATCTISVVSLVVGVFYGALSRKLGRFTLTFGFAVLALGMVVASLGESLVVILLGGVLIGVGVGIQQISTIYYISRAVSSHSVTLAVSVVLACVALGSSLSPLVLNGIEFALLGAASPSAGLLVAGVGFAVLTLIEGGQSSLCRAE
ncbi:MFS transporter [Adlercreutzia sp. R25]|uniref:MFS transporter n=2 Tax=Adlercreutzia shanghongiae TaxID=3111773 RepID=A0ABU6IX57_9ACTN|nr:MFS transporter [Adlercreutzia sp. R22]MEC4272658.1 MFS transporter [Adlercreutzia sp. R25]MEC4294441.1 MFS transporter [Adlercreutzia sp. R22]